MLVSSQNPVVSTQVNNSGVNFFEILPSDLIKQLINFMDADSQRNIYFLNESIRVIAINNVEDLPLVLCAKKIVSDLYNPEYATNRCNDKRYTDRSDEERKIFKSGFIQTCFNWISKKWLFLPIAPKM